LFSLAARAATLCVENDRRGKRRLQQIRGTWLVLRSQARLCAGIVCADWGCSKCRRRSGGSRSCVNRCWQWLEVVVVEAVGEAVGEAARRSTNPMKHQLHEIPFTKAAIFRYSSK
jgi:hypothetical protein